MSVPFSIAVGEETYPCSYSVAGDLITVTAAGKSKSTQIGGTPPLTLARMLARELIREREAA